MLDSDLAGVDDCEIDSISALLSAPDHSTRQALLPGAVDQAGQLASKMHALITTWSTTTDPNIAALVEHVRNSVDTHEAFAALWSDSLVDDGQDVDADTTDQQIDNGRRKAG